MFSGILLPALSLLLLSSLPTPYAAAPPNILLILADDLGQGNLHEFYPSNTTAGRTIETPVINGMAEKGLYFENAFVSPVCAPTRAMFFTGKHLGHTTIRGNDGSYHPLSSGEPTIASVVKKAGYSTALVGKWGLGDFGSSGYPLEVGFDHFVGYASQVGAHDWWPATMCNDLNKDWALPRNDGGCYTFNQDVFVNASAAFIRNKTAEGTPWLLTVGFVTPHEGNCEHPNNSSGVPAGPYAVPYVEPPYKIQPSWNQMQKDYASAITRQDRDIGTLLDLLQQLDIQENTLVLYVAGDNGPEAQVNDFFDSNSIFRGYKRSLYEGALRTPMFAVWPGVVESGRRASSAVVVYDLMATLAEVAGVSEVPATDGVSFANVLRGKPMPAREFMYWEFCYQSDTFGYGKGWGQVVRIGDMKGIRMNQNYSAPKPPDSLPFFLYNISSDPAEQTNLANNSAYAPTVQKIQTILQDPNTRTENPYWPSGPNCLDHCYTPSPPGHCAASGEDVD